MTHNLKVLGSSPGRPTKRPLEMIYSGWFTDYSYGDGNVLVALRYQMQIEPVRDRYTGYIAQDHAQSITTMPRTGGTKWGSTPRVASDIYTKTGYN